MVMKTNKNSLKSDLKFSKKLAFNRGARKIWTLMGNKELAKKANLKLQVFIYNYIYKIVEPCVFKYKDSKEVGIKSDDAIIWTCWWQGLYTAPQMIKNCIESIQKYSNGHKVVVISKDNYNDYVDIPEFIMNLVEEGKINFVKLANYIRISLLEKYGGVWFDGTIFCTANIPEDCFNYPYYTSKCPDKEMHHIAQGGWTFNFVCGWKGNVLFSYLREALEAYWKTTTEDIDYFWIDYIMKIGMDNIPIIKKMYDEVPCNSLNRYTILDAMKYSVPAIEWKNLIKEDTSIYKLNLHRDHKNTTSKGEETVYSYFIRKGYIEDE